MFQYLGSRGAQLQLYTGRSGVDAGFNTWAREEPNLRLPTCLYPQASVSILGLARSPTRRDGEQHPQGRFNTWAREEPNLMERAWRLVIIVSILGLARSPTLNPHDLHPLRMFQYLGSRGAQPTETARELRFSCFNTWAREEPNAAAGSAKHDGDVSILGLARSPTYTDLELDLSTVSFNTWAREEPNRT